MKFLGIIPARYSSTRLEGKPLKMIEGHTMIEWVYKRAKKSNLDALIVATDDERIYNEVINFGGQAIMTSKNHTNGLSLISFGFRGYCFGVFPVFLIYMIARLSSKVGRVMVLTSSIVAFSMLRALLDSLTSSS